MTDEKICPHVGEPCIGTRCSSFRPRITYTGYYNWGIQDEFKKLYCILTCQEYVEETYIATRSAHCQFGISSAYRWDKDYE